MMSKKTQLSLLLALFFLLSTLIMITNAAAAPKITPIRAPPPNLNEVLNGTTISLPFEARFEEASSSLAYFEIVFNATAWTYQGFSAYTDGMDITSQFNETIEDDHLTLVANEMDPANGDLNVSINFIAQPVEGNYTFTWSYMYSATPLSVPGMPDLKSDTGTTHIMVIPEFSHITILIVMVLTSITILLFRRKLPNN